MANNILFIVPEDFRKQTAYTYKTMVSLSLFKRYFSSYNIVFIGYFEKGVMIWRKELEGVKVIDLAKYGSFSHGFTRSLIYYFVIFIQIIKYKPIIVYMPTVFNIFFPLLFVFSKLVNSIIIYNMHDPIYLTMILHPDEVRRRARAFAPLLITLGSFVDRFIISLADYIIVPTPSLYVYAKHLKPIRKGVKIYLALNNNPVKARKIELINNYSIFKENKYIKIIFLGHLQPILRGIEFFLECYANIPPKVRDRTKVIFLGVVEDKDYFMKIIDRYGIKDNIIFLEPLPKAEAIYLATLADFGLIGKQHSFSLPNKLFDYLNAGIKPLVPDNMIDARIVLGDHILLYPSSSPEKCSEFFTKLLSQYSRNNNAHLGKGLKLATYRESISRILRDVLRDVYGSL